MPQANADRESDRVACPTLEDARRLAEWHPRLGVVSVYLRLDPGDRGGAWRTELRNGLAGILDGADGLGHEIRTALRATAKQIFERFANHERGLPRGEVGFVEVAQEPAAAHWWSTHLAPESARTACFGERPVVAPLLFLTERGAPRGVALVSAERVRLLEWRPGGLEELHGWELSVFSGDWRERKAQRVPDPARAQAVSSSGRERFGDRLADNRHRFLGECRRLALEIAAQRGWPELLAFGPSQHLECFRAGSESSSPRIETGNEVDLIATPLGEVEAPIEEAVERREAERERRLVEQTLEQARGGRRGSAGPRETLTALREGRVEQLVIDVPNAARSTASPSPEASESEGAASIDAEGLVRRALDSGAAIATVTGEAADQLAESDGVAALLRY